MGSGLMGSGLTLLLDTSSILRSYDVSAVAIDFAIDSDSLS